jgi:hypothetical protein
MKRIVGWGALAAALLVTASCATTGGPAGTAAPEPRTGEIAALDRRIGKEQDPAVLSGLLFERGHAYLEEAERIRDSRGKGGTTSSDAWEFSRQLLGALRDFEDIAANFPQSAEAPEALFHLGVIYDHPNLSSFGIALGYYRRTVEQYPGTESARKAQVAAEKIESLMRDVESGRHGAP